LERVCTAHAGHTQRVASIAESVRVSAFLHLIKLLCNLTGKCF